MAAIRSECRHATIPLTYGSRNLLELRERDRELSGAEETALFDRRGDDLGALVRFCMLSGARLGNATSLTWAQVDLNARVVTLLF